jgi:hypothetical protein
MQLEKKKMAPHDTAAEMKTLNDLQKNVLTYGMNQVGAHKFCFIFSPNLRRGSL